MISFNGEYECRLDDKGRVKIPSGLLKQLPSEAKENFFVNRGFEHCLILYPKSEWQNIIAEINKLNSFNEKTRKFRRYFYRGATELTLDSSDRILLPKQLFEWANIDKDITLFAHTNMVEIWDSNTYKTLLDDDPINYSELGEQVMGNINKNAEGN